MSRALELESAEDAANVARELNDRYRVYGGFLGIQQNIRVSRREFATWDLHVSLPWTCRLCYLHVGYWSVCGSCV